MRTSVFELAIWALLMLHCMLPVGTRGKFESLLKLCWHMTENSGTCSVLAQTVLTYNWEFWEVFSTWTLNNLFLFKNVIFCTSACICLFGLCRILETSLQSQWRNICERLLWVMFLNRLFIFMFLIKPCKSLTVRFYSAVKITWSSDSCRNNTKRRSGSDLSDGVSFLM